MKATKKIIAVLVCAFALCFALVGCDSGAEQYKKNFQGDWELAGLTEGDTTYSESYINWEPKDATTFKMTAMGDSIDGKLADGMISIEVEGAEMKFKKME